MKNKNKLFSLLFLVVVLPIASFFVKQNFDTRNRAAEPMPVRPNFDIWIRDIKGKCIYSGNYIRVSDCTDYCNTDKWKEIGCGQRGKRKCYLDQYCSREAVQSAITAIPTPTPMSQRYYVCSYAMGCMATRLTPEECKKGGCYRSSNCDNKCPYKPTPTPKRR